MQLVPCEGGEDERREMVNKGMEACEKDRMQARNTYDTMNRNKGLARHLLHESLVKQRKSTKEGQQLLLSELAHMKQTVNLWAGKWCSKDIYKEDDELPEQYMTKAE